MQAKLRGPGPPNSGLKKLSTCLWLVLFSATRKKKNVPTFQKIENSAKEIDHKETEKLLKEHDKLCHKQTQGQKMSDKEKLRLKKLKQLLKGILMLDHDVTFIPVYVSLSKFN